MCGIAGVMLGQKRPDLPWPDLLKRMGSTLSHRGPDDGGIWCDETVGVGLAHRRLSIVDLSAEGHQPMRSRNGRFVISYNGEIYNFQELRSELDYSWRGHSDTEVLLAAIETWGLEKAIQRCVGMFAVALWDHKNRTLSLVRDRMGVKPLYVGRFADGLVFGSELKALKAYPDFQPEIDRNSLALLFRYGYIPSPYSIYQDTWKLEPGTILTVRAGEANRPDKWLHKSYWSLRAVAEAGVRSPLDLTPQEAVTSLEEQLTQAVGQRMTADVPLGAFLSGGIDSSAIVALMQSQSTRPVLTFAIGFEEDSYNEAPHAKAVARHLGTDHTELYITPREAMATIPDLPSIYDEPFADWSQIPTFLVSQLARRDVTVTLSGDGGDELFFGYGRYLFGRQLQRGIGWMPAGARSALAKSLMAIPDGAWNRVFGIGQALLPSSVGHRLHGENVRKLANYLRIRTPRDLYHYIVSIWKSPESVVRGANEPLTVFSEGDGPKGLGFENLMMYLDGVSYLPDDILAKVDRATMAVGLEGRNPFLDHRVIEFAWQVPTALKIRNAKSKWILREMLYRHVPKELLERPKKGFGVPIGVWLRGPLRQWAEDLLDESRLSSEGYLRPEPIHALWKEHLSGERNWEYDLWNVLMFQAWLRTQHYRQSAPSFDDGSETLVGYV